LDLFCIRDEIIPAGESRLVKLGIKASAWGDAGDNVSWLLMPRSSISKTSLRLSNSVGLIDAGYRGEVMAAVDNVKSTDHHLKKGDRIVQAVAFGGGAVRFELVDALDVTSRGEGGFGSTAVTGATLPIDSLEVESTKSGAKLLIQPLCDEATELYKAHGQVHKGDSGLDLFAVRDETIPAGETRLVKLGIKVAAWSGTGEGASWLLMPRSSISKTPLRLCNSVGLIDAGYRGEVMAAVGNIKSADHHIKKGDRLVQAVAFDGGPINFELVAELDETSRGEGGFGSTGAVLTQAEQLATDHRLLIQPLCEEASQLYMEHGQYHKGDSGLDLFAVRDETIPAGETRFVKLGIKAAAWMGSSNLSWLLMPRSSISKTPLRLCNSVGLIDAGYRGEVMAAVDNVKGSDFGIKKGDRLVQAVSFSGKPISFKVVGELDATTRGEGGFGSTTRTLPTPQHTSAKVQTLEQ
jgi:dUTP pyrophosphatase